MEGFSNKYGITRKVAQFEPTLIAHDIWAWIFGDTLIPKNQIIQDQDNYDDPALMDDDDPIEPYERDIDEADNIPNSQDGE
jgi:hypothetical protein